MGKLLLTHLQPLSFACCTCLVHFKKKLAKNAATQNLLNYPHCLDFWARVHSQILQLPQNRPRNPCPYPTNNIEQHNKKGHPHYPSICTGFFRIWLGQLSISSPSISAARVLLLHSWEHMPQGRRNPWPSQATVCVRWMELGYAQKSSLMVAPRYYTTRSVSMFLYTWFNIQRFFNVVSSPFLRGSMDKRWSFFG